jgi:hypothetical protein
MASDERDETRRKAWDDLRSNPPRDGCDWFSWMPGDFFVAGFDAAWAARVAAPAGDELRQAVEWLARRTRDKKPGGLDVPQECPCSDAAMHVLIAAGHLRVDGKKARWSAPADEPGELEAACKAWREAKTTGDLLKAGNAMEAIIARRKEAGDA